MVWKRVHLSLRCSFLSERRKHCGPGEQKPWPFPAAASLGPQAPGDGFLHWVGALTCILTSGGGAGGRGPAGCQEQRRVMRWGLTPWTPSSSVGTGGNAWVPGSPGQSCECRHFSQTVVACGPAVLEIQQGFPRIASPAVLWCILLNSPHLHSPLSFLNFYSDSILEFCFLPWPWLLRKSWS